MHVEETIALPTENEHKNEKRSVFNIERGDRRIIKRCFKHERYAVERAKVWVCPECGCVLDAEELYGLLEKLGVDKKIIGQVRKSITALSCVRVL